MMSLPPGIAPEVARGLLGCQTTVLLRASSARCSSVQSNRGKVLRRPADTTIAGLGCQMGSDIGFAMRARKRIRMWFFTIQLKVLESSDQRVPVASVQETSIRGSTGKTVEPEFEDDRYTILEVSIGKKSE